jgi:hypothetical protein
MEKLHNFFKTNPFEGLLPDENSPVRASEE